MGPFIIWAILLILCMFGAGAAKPRDLDSQDSHRDAAPICLRRLRMFNVEFSSAQTLNTKIALLLYLLYLTIPVLHFNKMIVGQKYH
jgi:hypothetical protein